MFTLRLSVLYDLYPRKALRDRFCIAEMRVFTVRYALSGECLLCGTHEVEGVYCAVRTKWRVFTVRCALSRVFTVRYVLSGECLLCGTH